MIENKAGSRKLSAASCDKGTMRLLLSFVFLFFLTFFCNVSAHAQKTSELLLQDRYKRYGLESGMIEFVGEGGLMNTSEIVYFDRWGLRGGEVQDH